MLLKVDSLPNAPGKQPFIPLIDLGKSRRYEAAADADDDDDDDANDDDDDDCHPYKIK